MAKKNYYLTAVDEEKRSFSFILQKLTYLLSATRRSSADLTAALEADVDAITQSAFGLDDLDLPKELLQQYYKQQGVRSRYGNV